MADDRSDPIASTGAFRAFSSGDQADQPARRRPSPLVFWTTIVVLVAMVAGVLAFLL